MITEQQRRALFALREALSLCDDAGLNLTLNDGGPGMSIECFVTDTSLSEIGVYLCSTDIDAILEAHPDA